MLENKNISHDGSGFSKILPGCIIWGTEGMTIEKLSAIKISNLPDGATNPKIHLRRKFEGCASYELGEFNYTHVIRLIDDKWMLTDIVTAIDTI